MLIFHKVVGDAFKHFEQDSDSIGIVALANRFINCVTVR